jgi:hypothetical protein
MAGLAAPSRPHDATSWHWALVLVASVHLLTTAGAWSLTDHVEYAFVARRLLEHGGFDLAEPGVGRLDALPWLAAPDEGPLRTRLLPATALTLFPLIALDRWLGIDVPRQYGRLIHLQGHLFVLAGLACLGAVLRRSGASHGAAAGAIVLTGLVWPVWLIARRLGPEPILFFLVCLFLDARPWPASGRASLRPAQLGACTLLPWVSPTGPVLGIGLAGAGLLQAWLEDPRDPDARIRRVLGAAWNIVGLALGVGSVMLVWNTLYHGDWWLGGYAPYYAMLAPFGAQHGLGGLLQHLRALVFEGAPLILAALLGVRASPGRRASLLALPVTLTLGLTLMFAAFHQPEPARRLAAVWPAFGAVAGLTWDRLRLPPSLARALIVASGLLGFYWLMQYEGRRLPGPGGLFYPNVLWVERWLSGAPAWQWGPVLAIVAACGVAAAAMTARLLRRRDSGAAGGA